MIEKNTGEIAARLDHLRSELLAKWKTDEHAMMNLKGAKGDDLRVEELEAFDSLVAFAKEFLATLENCASGSDTKELVTQFEELSRKELVLREVISSSRKYWQAARLPEGLGGPVDAVATSRVDFYDWLANRSQSFMGDLLFGLAELKSNGLIDKFDLDNMADTMKKIIALA